MQSNSNIVQATTHLFRLRALQSCSLRFWHGFIPYILGISDPTRIWDVQTVYKRAHTVRTLLLLGRESADNSRFYSETRGVSSTLLLAVRISAVGLPQHRQ